MQRVRVIKRISSNKRDRTPPLRETRRVYPDTVHYQGYRTIHACPPREYYDQDDYCEDGYYDGGEYYDEEAHFSEIEEDHPHSPEPTPQSPATEQPASFSNETTTLPGKSNYPESNACISDLLKLPLSPPKDLLQQIWYPPAGAVSEIVSKDNIILFTFRGTRYGWFEYIDGPPEGFKVPDKRTWNKFEAFLAECTTDPSVQSRATSPSSDLAVGRHAFTRTVMDKFGGYLEVEPPSMTHVSKHPLYHELHKALNKHRIARTPKDKLLKLVQDVGAVNAQRRIKNSRDKPVSPKPHPIMAVKCKDDADNILSFITSKTAQTCTYVSDLASTYTFFTLPSHESLGLQHHLKEELLHLLGEYDYASGSTLMLEDFQKTNESNREHLERIVRFHIYGHKKYGQLAIQATELLGATCLLLRMEVTAAHKAP